MKKYLSSLWIAVTTTITVVAVFLYFDDVAIGGSTNTTLAIAIGSYILLAVPAAYILIRERRRTRMADQQQAPSQFFDANVVFEGVKDVHLFVEGNENKKGWNKHNEFGATQLKHVNADIQGSGLYLVRNIPGMLVSITRWGSKDGEGGYFKSFNTAVGGTVRADLDTFFPNWKIWKKDEHDGQPLPIDQFEFLSGTNVLGRPEAENWEWESSMPPAENPSDHVDVDPGGC